MKNINEYKEILSSEDRAKNFLFLDEKYKKKIFIICLFQRDVLVSKKIKSKYCITKSLSVEDFRKIIIKKENFKTDDFFIFTEIGQLMTGNEMLEKVYSSYSDKDGFLYFYIRNSIK